MKIPKTVKIAGHTMRVAIRDKLKCEVKGQILIGFAHLSRNLIELSRTGADGTRVCKSTMMEALCHEILHHISWRYKVNLRHPQIHLLAEGIYQVLKDNKELRF